MWRRLLLKAPPVDSIDGVAGASVGNRHAAVQKDGVRR